MHSRPEAVRGAQPLTWTPTTGNVIPPHAVPLHDGPNGQLYIARGLLGGDMHIGTTSYASSGGARVKDRYGRSHTVFEYEVLTLPSGVRFELPLAPPSSTRPIPPPAERERPRPPPNDPPPYRSPPTRWVEPPKQAGPRNFTERETVQLKRLTQAKCFTLIDDTPSMQQLWPQTRGALGGTVDKLSSDNTWDGVDVRFLRSEARACVKTRAEFERVFNSVTCWEGEKVMTKKVSDIFEQSLPLVLAKDNPRPVVLLIVTDNIACDVQPLFNAIVGFSQKLARECVPPHMFGIHLLQMGDDRKAVKPLHDFRDKVTQRDRERRILSVVSYHRGRGLLTAQNMVKLLVSSTYVPVEEDPDLRDRLPAEVVEAQYEEVERFRMMANR